MNPDRIDRNTSASRNGIFCEEYARRIIPGLEWVNGVYDAVIQGKPVDVKGCEVWYERSDRLRSKRRAGRVTLDSVQDAELKAQNGFYFCVVHCGELVVKSFFIRAVRVPFSRQLAWTTMQKLAEVV